MTARPPGPALFFHDDAVEGEGRDLIGRRSAGQSFLRGFLAHVPAETVHAVTETPAAARAFADLVRALGETRPLDVRPLNGERDFTAFGTIFFPVPGYQNAPWLRQRFGPTSCSLVGITHTVSTRRVMGGIHRLLSEPVHDWDAIICTSPAVRSVVARQLEAGAAYLTERFGAARVPQPQLPVIPLGIQAAEFLPRPGAREDLRRRLGAGDAFVVLTVGRLTSVEKANPVPLYRVLEQIAQTLDRPVHLWQVGWSSRADEDALHAAGAKALCPSVTVHRLDGRDPEIRRDIWAGADVFTLPVDNVQETFGLVPLEAMAAGLPVVMPDWNGFRATVRHGETGFLIPTRMPGPGLPLGAELAARFADGRDGYLHHLSLLQQQTQIEVGAYRAALEALARDAGLRARLGQAGRRHVQAQFDWSAVIPRYLDLATELAERRTAARIASGARAGVPLRPAARQPAARQPAVDPAPRPVRRLDETSAARVTPVEPLPLANAALMSDRAALMPLELDPFELYAGYPSQVPNGHWTVATVRDLDEDALRSLDALNGRALYGRRQMPDARIVAVSRMVRDAGPLSVLDLAKRMSLRGDLALVAVLFLAKYDYLELNPPQR